ncbi:hypothetical protein ACFOPN_05155 [Xanthomonas hyacinthi]|uniref:hypothetical protein n=1 Tax=Xanthomonas hyacinthi TaxID=56455 RepID=UPI00062D0C12|nr:hypothetical protein Y886_36085 [Xanthomonas hyacinthi DSM 19077]
MRPLAPGRVAGQHPMQTTRPRGLRFPCAARAVVPPAWRSAAMLRRPRRIRALSVHRRRRACLPAAADGGFFLAFAAARIHA